MEASILELFGVELYDPDLKKGLLSRSFGSGRQLV